jgi:hypothetical protein
VDRLLVVSRGAKAVIHARAAKFIGGRGLQTPDIDINPKNEVESRTVDAYFAPAIQEWE